MSMSYSSDKPFKDREHMLWEIGYCNRAGTYLSIATVIGLLLGIISNVIDMKLALDSTSWFLVSIVLGVMSLAPDLHVLFAKHLLGMELIKKAESTK